MSKLQGAVYRPRLQLKPGFKESLLWRAGPPFSFHDRGPVRSDLDSDFLAILHNRGTVGDLFAADVARYGEQFSAFGISFDGMLLIAGAALE
jgi:hypothetical protein